MGGRPAAAGPFEAAAGGCVGVEVASHPAPGDRLGLVRLVFGVEDVERRIRRGAAEPRRSRRAGVRPACRGRPASATAYARSGRMRRAWAQASPFRVSTRRPSTQVMEAGSTATRTGRAWKRISSRQPTAIMPRQRSSSRARARPAASPAAAAQRPTADREGASARRRPASGGPEPAGRPPMADAAATNLACRSRPNSTERASRARSSSFSRRRRSSPSGRRSSAPGPPARRPRRPDSPDHRPPACYTRTPGIARRRPRKLPRGTPRHRRSGRRISCSWRGAAPWP